MKRMTILFAVLITALMASTVSAQTQLATPTIKSAYGVSTTGITANWTALAALSGATGYDVKIYDASNTIVDTRNATGETTATLAITGLTLAKNTPYTYTITAIGDGGVLYTNSAESTKSIPFYIQTDNQVVFKYAVADVTTLFNDMKSTVGTSGASDIYELTESGGAYTFVTTTANNVVLAKNTTVRAAAGLAAKPIVKLNSTATGTTSNIFYTATLGLTLRFDGLEFDGVNPGIGGYQPLAIYDSSTGASNIQLYITNCYFHDFKNLAGNGTIRLNGSSGAQTLDIQGCTFNACGGRIIYPNGTTTGPATTIVLKNTTFSNSLTLTSRNNVIYNAVANSGTTTIDHCTFYKVADAAVSSGIIRITGSNGGISIKNSTFVTTPATLPTATIDYCYLAGLTTVPAPSGTVTNTFATAPTYGAGASSTPPDLSLTNRGSLTCGDTYTAGNKTYYNLVMPTVGTASDATSAGFIANWTAVANASSYDVYVYQNGTQVGSVRNASGQATASLAITALDASTAYTYRVMAKGDGTNYFNAPISAASAPVSTLAPSGTPLNIPEALDATFPTTYGFTANWRNTDEFASGGYNVKVYNGATLVNTYNASGASATSLTITGLTYNTAFTYTVTAIGNGSTYTNSIPSNIISISTNDRTTLTPPTAYTAESIDYTSYNAKWSVDATASSFSIKTYCGGNLISTTTASAGSTSVTVSGLLTGIDYTYTVTAIGDGITYITSAASNTISVQTLGRVNTINTDFNDGSWGTILVSVPSQGAFPTATINGFTLNKAALTANTNKGPKGESHTNRMSMDKLVEGGSVTLPTFASLGQLEIHFAMGTAGNTINLKEYSSATNTWSLVGSYAYDAANKTAGLDQIVIVPFETPRTNAKLKIENNTSGSCYIVQVIARTTNPLLLNPPTVGTANNIKATTFFANWTPNDLNASGYGIKVYKATTFKASASINGQATTSSGVTGLQADSTYTFKVQSLGDGDVYYSDSYQTIASEPFVAAHQDYFQSSGSGNWSDVGIWQSSIDNATWTNSIISPSSTSVASIAVLNGHTVTVAANATASILTVNPGGKLTLNNGISLTASTLNINSNNTNGTGTFVDNGGTLTATTTNVNQYLTSGRNWYMSSPVELASVSGINTATGSSMVSYDEVHGSTTPWPVETTTLTPGKGYIVASPSNPNPTITFTGTLNTGIQPISLSRTTGQAKEGFNLIGNPYPSYVNWDLATLTNVSTTIWYRTRNTREIPAYVFDTYNGTSQVGTNNNLSGDVTGMIPPMQAVWAHVSDGSTSGSVSFDNSMRSHATASTSALRAESAQQVLRLQVSNDINSDEAIVVLNANASNNLDAFDSRKMSNNDAAIPEIYTMSGNEALVINGINTATEMPLGFRTGAQDLFTIKASEIGNFDADTRIILKDNALNTQTDLTDGSIYRFSSDVANTTNRFSILFKSAGTVTGLASNGLANNYAVYVNANHQIVVANANKKNVTVSIHNLMGQLIEKSTLSGNTTQIGTKLTSGVYFVRVRNENNMTTVSKVKVD